MSERIRNIVAHGSIPEFQNDGDDLDRIYLPVRGIQIAQRLNGCKQELFLVILPETPEVREFVCQTEEIFGEICLRKTDTLLMPDTDYFLDKAIEANIKLVEDVLEKEDRHILWPYANTHVSDGWTCDLYEKGFKIENALPKKEYKVHQTRSFWGRRVTQPDKLSFPEKYGIPYPVSYIAQGSDELVEAYKKVYSLTGNSVVYLKLSASAGGFGVSRVSSEEELKRFYEITKNSGALYLFGDKEKELDIEVQEEIQGLVGFASIQYLGNKLETPGGISVQLLEGNNWVGNKFNVMDGYLTKRSREIFENFSNGMLSEHVSDFYGWGGIDLGIVKNGNYLDLVVVENNWGRVTGAHPGIYFANALGISEKPFLVRKLKPPKVDAKECWKMLKKEGVSYDPQLKKGAVPIPWVRDVDAFVFVAGDSDSEISKITDRVMNLVSTNGYH